MRMGPDIKGRQYTFPDLGSLIWVPRSVLFGTYFRGVTCHTSHGEGWLPSGQTLSSKNVTGDNDAAKMAMRSNLFGNLRLAVLCTRSASLLQAERQGTCTQTDDGFG